MLCCSIAAFLLSQCYALVMGARSLLFGSGDLDLARPAASRLAALTHFTPLRLAGAMAVGGIGLGVALALPRAAIAGAEGWVPVATSFCGGALG